MVQQAKRGFSVFLAIILAVSVLTVAPVSASAEATVMTLAELQEQRPELFIENEYVENSPILCLIDEYTIPAGVTLVVSAEQGLYLYNFGERNGQLTVGKGATLMLEGYIDSVRFRAIDLLGIWGEESRPGLVIEEGGVMIVSDIDSEYTMPLPLNDVVNDGTIVIGEKRMVLNDGNFIGNRPVGNFHLQDDTAVFDEEYGIGALNHLIGIGPHKEGRWEITAFPTYRVSGFDGTPIYWSVEETQDGFVYKAEAIPLYQYDGMWIYDQDRLEIDYTKPIETENGVITFGTGDEFTVVVCTYHPVSERDETIDGVIESQGERPVVGTITAPSSVSISTKPILAGSDQPSEAPNLSTAATWAQEAIQSAYEKGFIPTDIQNDYTNTITRAEFCRMAVKWLEYRLDKPIDTILAEKGLTLREDAFSDTTDKDILAAFALGITNGTSAPTAGQPGTFTPDGAFTREQAATMIMNTCKAAGMDVSDTEDAGFEDIDTASSWAVDGINFCRNNGIMNGTSTTPLVFSPKLPYTREQSIMTFDNIE